MLTVGRLPRKKGGDTMAFEENYRFLCVAVVTQVIEEYKDALRNNLKPRILYYEKWLRSDWCYLLSGMDGDYIINSVRKAVQDEETDRRNDSIGVEKIHKKTYKKSKYKVKKYK